MKRGIALVLVVCLVASSPAPLAARQLSGISIASIDRGSVKPFQKIVIRGSGFTPATAAISVVFIPRSRGQKVTVPAYSATASSIEVIVPPVPDPANTSFGFGAFDVQVVQVTTSAVSSSNVMGLDIAPMTAVPSSLRRGAVVRGYLRALRSALEAARTGPRATPQSAAAIDTYLSSQAELLGKVDRIVADGSYATTLPTGDNAQFVIDARALQFADQMLLAYMEGIESFSATSTRDVATTLEFPACDPDTGEIDMNATICAAAQALLRNARPVVVGMLVAAGAVVLVGALGFGAPMMGLAGGIVAIGMTSLAVSYMINHSAICASVASAAALTEPIPFSEAMRDQGRKLLDTAREYGAAVPAIANAAMDVFATTAHAAGTPSTGPQGGLAVNIPNQDPADGHAMLAVRGSGTSATTERLAASSSASTRAIADARLPALTASIFDGSYSGSVTWFATDGEESLSGTLGVSLSIAGGRVTVSAPIPGGGTVSATGSTSGSVNGGGLSCGFSGGFTSKGTTGAASGGGVFGCRSSDGSVWGSWGVSRR